MKIVKLSSVDINRLKALWSDLDCIAYKGNEIDPKLIANYKDLLKDIILDRKYI